MALPGDVSTFSLTFGHSTNGYTDATGAVVLPGTKAKLFPVDLVTGRRLNVTHVATGQVIIPTDVTITIDEDGKATVGPLPHTDNATLSPIGFGYRVEWQVASGRRRAAPRDLTFAVPTAAGATVDFDLLDVADAVPGVLVPMGIATGLADTVVAGLIPGPSATATALGAAYGLVFKAHAATYGTNTVDATAHIQGLIDAAEVAGGGTVFIPAGRYKMSGELVLPMCGVDSTDPQVNIVGAGRQASKLIWAADLGAGKFGITFPDRASGSASMSLGLIADLYLQGPALTNAIGGTPALMSGIGHTARREIRGVRITGFYAGLCVTGDHTQFEHVNCGLNRYGLYYDLGNPALWGALKFIDCQFNGNYVAGVAVSPNSSIDGGFFQNCWIGYQPYGLYKESGAGSNGNFVSRTIFDHCGFELEGNGLARDASGAAEFIETEFRHCYTSGDGSFKWSGQPSDALFDLHYVSKVRILGPQGEASGWGPRDQAVFKTHYFNQSVIEDPNNTICNAVNAAGKVFAIGSIESVKVLCPGVWEGQIIQLGSGAVAPQEIVHLLDNAARRATGYGIPYGVAMTGSSTALDQIVIATSGRAIVAKDASVTGRNLWVKASATAGKAGMAGSGDQVFGMTVDPVDNTAGTATVILRLSAAPPPVFLESSMNIAGNGATVAQSIGGGAFITVNISEEATDTASAFNTTTHIFTVPSAGIYECSAKVRVLDDTTGSAQFGLGIHTSNSDGPHFLWQMIDSEGTAGNRRMVFDYYRKAMFNAGDQLRLYVFSQNPISLAMASLTIQKSG